MLTHGSSGEAKLTEPEIPRLAAGVWKGFLLAGVGIVRPRAPATAPPRLKANPSALGEAAGATAAFVAALGAYGYATRRDLSSWARTLFWLLLALIVFGVRLL